VPWFVPITDNTLFTVSGPTIFTSLLNVDMPSTVKVSLKSYYSSTKSIPSTVVYSPLSDRLTVPLIIVVSSTLLPNTVSPWTSNVPLNNVVPYTSKLESKNVLPYTSKSLNTETIPLTFNNPPKVVLPLTLRVDFNNVYCYTSKDPNIFVL